MFMAVRNRALYVLECYAVSYSIINHEDTLVYT